MKSNLRKVLAIIISSALCLGVLAGCSVTIDPGKEADEKIDIKVVGTNEEADEDDKDDEDENDEEKTEKVTRSLVKADGKDADRSFAVGTWYTEDYDENDNWAVSYKIVLYEDGEADCEGYRNRDYGTYEVTGDDTVLITFDDCRTSSFRENYETVEGFVYTIEMKIKGDDAKIKIDAPEVISNLEDGTVHRKSEKTGTSRMYSSEEEGDEGEGADIADGEYLTDETYTGELSKDGKTMTITTALNHEDENWELVQDYEKRTYVFTVSDKCKCIVAGEKREEDPFFDRLDFIEEFLEGNSGLPITLTIKNNELVAILFTS